MRHFETPGKKFAEFPFPAREAGSFNGKKTTTVVARRFPQRLGYHRDSLAASRCSWQNGRVTPRTKSSFARETAMPQAVVDPAELRRFAHNLKRFNPALQPGLSPFPGQMVGLGDTSP